MNADARKGRIGFLDTDAPVPVYVTLVYRGRRIASRLVSADEASVAFVLSSSDITLAPITVGLRVVDEHGEPVPEANVALQFCAEDEFGLPVVDRAANAITSADGVAFIETHHGGLVRVYVYADGYADTIAVWEFLREGNNELGVIRISRPRVLHGLVLDDEGKPAAADIVWHNLDGQDESIFLPCEWGCESAVHGRFVLPKLGANRYRVTAHGECGALDGFASAIVDMKDNNIPHVALNLEATFPVVIEAEGKNVGLRRFYVVVYDVGWNYIITAYLGGGCGVFRLPKGAYRYRILSGLEKVAAGDFDVCGDVPSVIRFSF